MLVTLLLACDEDHEFTIKDETAGVLDQVEDTDSEPSTGAAPQAEPDAYSADRDRVLVVEVSDGLLANDTSPQALPLVAVLVAPPSSGTLSLSPDGSFEYQPTPGFLGADSFQYRVTDGTLESLPVTVQIEVVVPNDPPLVQDDTYEVALDTELSQEPPGVLANDTDPEGDLLAVSLQLSPTYGTLVLEPDGSFLYTPQLGYQGFDSFVYEVTDTFNAPVQGTVTLAVGDVPYPPVATDDTLQAASGVARVIEVPGVLYNDSDPDGDPIYAVLDTPPANGTLDLSMDGSFTYTSTSGFVGQDTFTYRATDGALESAPATVTVHVSLNTPPTAAEDGYGALSLLPLVVNAGDGVLANDSDEDGDPLTAVLLDDVSHGTLSLDADGSFTYDADLLFIGVDTFTYQASDGLELSPPVTVEIGVL